MASAEHGRDHCVAWIASKGRQPLPKHWPPRNRSVLAIVPILSDSYGVDVKLAGKTKLDESSLVGAVFAEINVPGLEFLRVSECRCCRREGHR